MKSFIEIHYNYVIIEIRREYATNFFYKITNKL